jgi:UDP-glucose 4-epimerase
MPTALVTGGSGFIGSHLVESLLARGRRVIVIDDLSTGNLSNLDGIRDHPALRVVLDSINNQDCFASLLNESDEVYHLAAVVGVRLVMEEPERTVSTNLDPTAFLLQHLAANPRPVFIASTSEVYGKNPKMPLQEDDDIVLGPTTRSRWVYACSKAIEEYLALAEHRRSGLPVVIGRFFNVVGPRQVGRYGMVLPRFIDQALSGGPLVVHDDGQQVRCFAHVSDIVRAVMQLLEAPEASGHVFNLGSDSPVTIRELAETVTRLIDPRLKIEHISYEHAFGDGFEDIRCRIPDLSRVRQAIGYRPRHGLEDVVREVIAWRKAQIASAGCTASSADPA